jgi:hypothetical protein
MKDPYLRPEKRFGRRYKEIVSGIGKALVTISLVVDKDIGCDEKIESDKKQGGVAETFVLSAL